MKLIADESWAILTIWMEARGEPFAGMVGVGEVIFNRLCRRFYSDGTIAGTCLAPYQFSGWNTKDPNRMLAAKLDDTNTEVIRCQHAWHLVYHGDSHMVGGALFYYNPKLVTPTWEPDFMETAFIGKHRFGKLKGDGVWDTQ